MGFVDGGGSGPTPKNSTGPGIIQRIDNFFSRLFSSRGAGIKTYLPGASVSYRVQTGEWRVLLIEEPDFWIN